jgi:hypothetical protein
METVSDVDMPSEVLLERIDAILRDLLELRQAVASRGMEPQGNLTGQLFGSLGHGSWDEYDPALDWQTLGS